MKQLGTILKLSRPGLWFATIWLYTLTLSGQEDLLQSWIFWLGLIYCCFPLNLLVYGWNDIVDYEADRINPRKGNFLFGAKAPKKTLESLWKWISFTQVIFYPFFIWIGGYKIMLLFLLQLLILWLYNLPKNGLRSRPPLELTCQIGYLLVVPFSSWINGAAVPPSWTLIYLVLFAFQSHLMGEVMDIIPDRQAGKITTATKIGLMPTKVLIMTLVLFEITISILVFEDYVFSSMLAGGLIWLLLDALVIFKRKSYTLGQMKLFGYGSNAIGFASIIYVWWSGCLL